MDRGMGVSIALCSLYAGFLAGAFVVTYRKRLEATESELRELRYQLGLLGMNAARAQAAVGRGPATRTREDG